MKTLAVGQRFDVFEVITDHPGRNFIPIGWQTVGIPDKQLSSAHVIYSNVPLSGCMFTMWQNDIKKVGTLVIKTLK